MNAPTIDLNEELGRRIRARRRQLEISQEDLADVIGVARSTLTNIEAGRYRMTVELVIKIAAALSIDGQDLIPEL